MPVTMTRHGFAKLKKIERIVRQTIRVVGANEINTRFAKKAASIAPSPPDERELLVKGWVTKSKDPRKVGHYVGTHVDGRFFKSGQSSVREAILEEEAIVSPTRLGIFYFRWGDKQQMNDNVGFSWMVGQSTEKTSPFNFDLIGAIEHGDVWTVVSRQPRMGSGKTATGYDLHPESGTHAEEMRKTMPKFAFTRKAWDLTRMQIKNKIRISVRFALRGL